jgi:glucan-binding YG repeat protein
MNFRKRLLTLGMAGCLTVPSYVTTITANAASNSNHVIRIEAEDYSSANGNITIRQDGEEVPTGYDGEAIQSITLSGASGGEYIDFSIPVKSYTTSGALSYSVGVSDNVTWKVNIPKAGLYRIKFKYNNPGTRWGGYRNARDERNARILINGNQSDLTSDTGWAGWMIFCVSGYNDSVLNSTTPASANITTQSAASISGNTQWNNNYMNVYFHAGEQELTLAMQAPPGQAVYDGPNLDYFELEYIGDKYVDEDSVPTFSGTFNHPGIYYTLEDLETFKKNKNLEGSVWQKGYQELINSSASSSSYTRGTDSKNVDPVTGTQYWQTVERGPYNNPDKGSSPFAKDGLAAHYNALRWYLDGDINNAKKTIGLLNGWASTLQNVTNNDARLIVAISAPAYVNAAEIIKHIYNNDPNVSEADKWSQADMDKFDSFVRRLNGVVNNYYPQANGNWDALISAANMSMGVYLDDKDMFNKALRQFTSGDAIPGVLSMGALPNDIYETGEDEESNRDQIHANMGVDGLSHSAEVAWNQGINLFKLYDNRILKGVDYSIRYNYSKEDVDSETFISDKSRGLVHIACYDIVANYYKHYNSSVDDLDLLEEGAEAAGTGAKDEGAFPCGFINAALFTQEDGKNYTNLNNAIEEGKAKLTELISDLDKANLSKTIEDNKKLLVDSSLSQDEIDSATEKLEELINNIKVISTSSTSSKHHNSSSSNSSSSTSSNSSSNINKQDENANNINNSNNTSNVNTIGWKNNNGSWYYFSDGGNVKIGWLKDNDGKWYYLGQSGEMKTGWLKDNDGKWYYLDQSGEMKTGWFKDSDGKWYYLDQSGAMATGWLKDSDGKWYYLNQNGELDQTKN